MEQLKENDDVLMICQCESEEHQVIFRTSDEYISAAVHLTQYKSFWKRLVHGIKYIFGHKSNFFTGAFDYILLKPEDYSKLQLLTDYLKVLKDKEEDGK